MKTITTWVAGHQFISQQDNQKISIDGNLQQGMSPKALLLSGIAGCSGIDVVDILQKMRVPFTRLEVEAAADQTEDHPRVFSRVDLVYKADFPAGQADKFRKAIDLSLEKYCGVAAMLRKNSPIEYRIERL
jgi:putative redox protein